ncbi:hypothetical protein WA026_001906 [Henosepilachna vigintioctopunctata]|uniref:Uncharacterized protein n=1 Tax=Henosepilachna vigintioctopunctata TaxID=420089 RepID=A0AAW1UT95_9CUCU
MSSELVKMQRFLVLCLLIAVTAAKPSHFTDNQVSPDAEKGDFMDPGLLRALERYDALRRLASDYENANILNQNPLEPLFRNTEMKRQGRSYRPCYFNPISCFKK